MRSETLDRATGPSVPRRARLFEKPKALRSELTPRKPKQSNFTFLQTWEEQFIDQLSKAGVQENFQRQHYSRQAAWLRLLPLVTHVPRLSKCQSNICKLHGPRTAGGSAQIAQQNDDPIMTH